MNHNLILKEDLLPDLACRDMQVTKGDRVQYVTTSLTLPTNDKLHLNFKQNKFSEHNNVQRNGENSYWQDLRKSKIKAKRSPRKKKNRFLKYKCSIEGSWNEVKAY